MNSLGQSLEDRLVRWENGTNGTGGNNNDVTPASGVESGLVSSSDRPTKSPNDQEATPAQLNALNSLLERLTPEQKEAFLAGSTGKVKTQDQIKAEIDQLKALTERTVIQALIDWETLKGHADAVAEAKRKLDATIDNMTTVTAQNARQMENQRGAAERQLALAEATFEHTKQVYLDQQEGQEGLVAARIENLRIQNGILQAQLNDTRARSQAATLTANLGNIEAARQFTLKSEIDRLLERKHKAQAGVLETITMPVSDDDALQTGLTPTTTQQRVTWTEEDEAILQAKYKALEAYTGVVIPDEGSGKGQFNLTAQTIAQEAARDRAHDERLARANITAEIMMSQSSQQLQVAVANGQMTMEAALTVYEQRNANARTYVQMELDRAELQFKDLASTRAYAANLITSEMDLTKFLLERRVPEEREWLRAPGTPVGGPAGQPLDPIRVDPQEVARRVTKEMGIGEKTKMAEDAAMRAVVEAERRLGSAQEAAPTVPTIATPDPVSPAETAAALIPTGAP